MSEVQDTLKRIEFRTLVGAGLAIVLVVVFLLYTIFQARFLISGPSIVISNNPAVLQTERVVTITGSAYNITHLWLNDRPIFTDELGHFKEDIILPSGYTIVTLRARDRYDREARVEREFVYKPVRIDN